MLHCSHAYTQPAADLNGAAAEPESITVLSPIVLLVVGECGDGKSTLINNLRDPKSSEEAKFGRDVGGVTKKLTKYKGKPINGKLVELIDTPGVGDKTVSISALISQIESELGGNSSVDGVLVTSKASNSRVGLGAQILQLIVEKGIVGGEEKWENIILVGTMSDKADQEDTDHFLEEVKCDYFKGAKDTTTAKCVLTTNKGDDCVTSLTNAIEQLPNAKVRYKAPDAADMGDAIAEKVPCHKLYSLQLRAQTGAHH